MNRIFGLLIFFAILIALDFYVFQGFKLLVKRWIPDYSQVAHIVYWALPILLFGALILSNVFGSDAGIRSNSSRWIVTAIFMLYLFKLVWLLFIVIDDVVRFVRFLFNASDRPNEDMLGKIKRSEFIVGTGALVASTLFGGLLYGVVRGAHNYTVKNRAIRLKNLPKSLEGLRIVQISDIHSGSFWSKNAVSKGVEMIMEQKADLIFFTGDLVNDRAEEFEPFLEMFSKIEAPLGVYSVLGNHDYGDYASWPDANGITKEQNLENLKQHHANAGWRLLMNEEVQLEHKNEKISIIGIENWSSHPRFPKYGSLKDAYQGSDSGLKLLLSHDPSHWKAEVVQDFKDIDITFSGHTHGMQFGVDSKHYRWSPVKYQYPEWADLYQEGDQFLYVNRGFGYLGYPGRLGFYPEITVFELKSDLA
ncbi:metallophosphoesterase [bacterium]|nr:metallophosphoesterase [bacterium]